MRQEKRIRFGVIFFAVIWVKELLEAHFFWIPVAHQAMRNLGLRELSKLGEGLNEQVLADSNSESSCDQFIEYKSL